MTCIEARVLEVCHIANEQFPSAIRKIPLEEYELHFAPRAAGEGYPVFEELLPERGVHSQSLGLDEGIIAVGIWI